MFSDSFKYFGCTITLGILTVIPQNLTAMTRWLSTDRWLGCFRGGRGSDSTRGVKEGCFPAGSIPARNLTVTADDLLECPVLSYHEPCMLPEFLEWSLNRLLLLESTEIHFMLKLINIVFCFKMYCTFFDCNL